MDLIDALLAIPRGVGSAVVGPQPQDGPPLTTGQQVGRGAINLLAFAGGGLQGLGQAHQFHRAFDETNSSKAQVERQVAQAQLEALNDSDPVRASASKARLAGLPPAIGDQMAESQTVLQALNLAAGKHGVKFSFTDGKLSISGEDLPGDEQFYNDVASAQANADEANKALAAAQSSQRAVVLPRTAGGFQVRTLDIPLYSQATREAVSQLGEYNAVSPGLAPFLPGGGGAGPAGPAQPAPTPGVLPRGAAGAKEDAAARAADRASKRTPEGQRTAAASMAMAARDVLRTIAEMEPLLTASRLGLAGSIKGAAQDVGAMLGVASPKRGTFDPELSKLDYLSTSLVYAQALMNNPDRRLSEADAKAAREQLGFDSWRSNPEAVRAKLEEMKRGAEARLRDTEAMMRGGGQSAPLSTGDPDLDAVIQRRRAGQ